MHCMTIPCKMKVNGKFINIMILLLCFVFFSQLFGIFFHVGQKVLEIDARTPDDTLSQVISVFLKENIISLILSGGILLLDLFAHIVLSVYTEIPSKDVVVPVVDWSLPFPLVAVGVSLLIGYTGQRGLYWFLERVRVAAKKKIEEKI